MGTTPQHLQSSSGVWNFFRPTNGRPFQVRKLTPKPIRWTRKKKWMATTESTWIFFGHPKLIALFPCRLERFEKLLSKEVTPALLQKNFSKAEFWTPPFCSPVNHHPIFSDFFYQIHSHFDQVRFTWPHPEDQVDHPWSQLQTSFPGIIFVHIFFNRWSQETHKPILSSKKHMFANLDHRFRGEHTSWWFQPIWKILVKLDHFPR